MNRAPCTEGVHPCVTMSSKPKPSASHWFMFTTSWHRKSPRLYVCLADMSRLDFVFLETQKAAPFWVAGSPRRLFGSPISVPVRLCGPWLLGRHEGFLGRPKGFLGPQPQALGGRQKGFSCQGIGGAREQILTATLFPPNLSGGLAWTGGSK